MKNNFTVRSNIQDYDVVFAPAFERLALDMQDETKYFVTDAKVHALYKNEFDKFDNLYKQR